MTPTSFPRLGIQCQQSFSLLHPSRPSVIAKLLHAWATDAAGAIAQAETALSKSHPALYAEYQCFLEANPRAPRWSKAEMWCRQELEGPVTLPTPLLSDEPSDVLEPTCLLLNKRHRPCVDDGGFKRPRPVHRMGKTPLKPAQLTGRSWRDMQAFMLLHTSIAVQLKRLPVLALSMAQAKCRAFMDKFQ